MKLTKITALTALAGLAFGLALTASAEAAPKKQPKYIYYGSPDRMVYPRGRAPTRVTVYRRSYLSGGTETLQRDQRYTDYSHPPNYIVPGVDRGDFKVNFSRSPMPDPWDIPGWPKF